MKPPSGHPQQGAMFNVKPAASHQWPRGYTPDRLHETQAALGKIKTPSRMFPPYAKQLRYEMTGVVARSTAPLNPQNFPQVTMMAPTNKSTSGSFRAPSEEKPRGQISVEAERGVASQHSLLHEIGHHTDFQADPDAYKATFMHERVAFSVGGRRGSASPSLEGYAEGFAANHFRQDPRDKKLTNSDQLRGYDRVYGNNEAFRSNFARAGANPARINSARHAAPDLSPRASQEKLF